MRTRQEKQLEQEMWLGQVKASLRPMRIDPVEVREVLLSAAAAGQNPSDLYLSAVESRPQEYEAPPPLAKVLPAQMLRESLSQQISDET